MIGDVFNFEDTFFRDLTACVLDTLEGNIKWVNRFTSGDYAVNVPFYYSLTGDERFLLDSFQDDIISENRFVELNTDIIPRGHITFKDFAIKEDEFTNPNVWLRMVVENQKEIKKVLTKIRAVPITVNYELNITLSNEIDTFKASQAILDTLWVYKFMYFEYNFMNIDAVILLPDNQSIEINREKDLTSDNNIKLSVNFTVETYYPAFRKDRVNLEGYPTSYQGGMTDMNSYVMEGGFSEYFTNGAFNHTGSHEQDITETPNIRKNSMYLNNYIGKDPNASGSSITGYPTGTNPDTSNFNKNGPSDSGYFVYTPKPSRWFSNILKTREKNRKNYNGDDNSNLSE